MANGKGLVVLLLICLLSPPLLAQQATQPLALSDALALALKGNPDLAAYSWDIRAAEARQIQAGLRPNPELSIEVENVRIGSAPHIRTSAWSITSTGAEVVRSTETSASDEEITIALSQVIELGGKRARRLELAARDRDTVAWDYEIARVNVLRDVVQAYVKVLAAQDRVALDDELAQLSERVLDAVTARVEAGRVSPLEQNKAQTALASARVQAERSKNALAAARTRLASLWGDTEASFQGLSGSFDTVCTLPDWQSLTNASEQVPDLKRWQAELEKRGAAIRLEKANRIPDVTVSAGLRKTRVADSDADEFGFGSDGFSYSKSRSRADDDYDNSVVVGVSVPLPLFNRNQGAIKEAEHLAAKAAEQRRAAAVGLNASLRQAYEDAAGAYTAILALRDGMLPVATQTFESFNEAYAQGKFGSLDVLDAQRTLFELRREYLNALTDYHVAVADLERLTGAAICSVEPTISNENDKGK